MKYELEIISDITSNNKGKVKILVKSARIKRLFDLDKIDISVYIDPRTGREIKKYSSVTENDIYYKVNKPYENLKSLILNRTTPIIGLMAKSKLYRKKIKAEEPDYNEGLPIPEHLGNTDSYYVAYCKKKNKKK